MKRIIKKITYILSVLIWMGLGHTLFAQGYSFNVISGRPPLNDGKFATVAPLSDPSSIVLDASGNLYIADREICRVRKVDGSTGIISTIAGDGTPGFSGDGGVGTSAKLSAPNGVSLDGLGNLYIADYGNNRIRKLVLSTGIITTIAGNGTRGFSGDGGLATGAQLNLPGGQVVDASGNIYIIDSYNHRIRKVDKTTGIITTLAGNGTAGFSGDGGLATAAQLNIPTGLVIDASGNFYIADYGNQRIRKLTTSTGIITTIAGNGTAGFSGDGGLATAAQFNNPSVLAIDGSGNLYISDRDNHRIRKIEVVTGNITTVAGNGVQGFSGDGGLPTSARLWQPAGLNFDSFGNLYIADQSNQRIRKVGLLVGIISTVAGTGVKFTNPVGFFGDGSLANEATFNFATQLATDLSDNLYISDRQNQRIRMIEKASGIIKTVAGNGTAGYAGDGGLATFAQLNYPDGLSVDGSGNLYIADKNNHRIRKVDATTKIITTVAGNGTAGYAGDGGLATSSQIDTPNSIATDASGNVYICDYKNNRIRKITVSTGIISTVAGTGVAGFSGDAGLATVAQLNLPTSVAVDASGNLYISDHGNSRIRKVVLSSGIISTVAGNGTIGFNGDGGIATAAQLAGPYQIDFDTFGNLYFTDYGSNYIRKVDLSTGIISTLYSSVNSAKIFVYTPFGLAIDGSDNIFVVRFFDNAISKLVFTKGNQTISFSLGSNSNRGTTDGPITLTGTSSSGLPLAYSSSNTSVATISGSTLSIVGAGTSVITASQTGNSNFNPSTSVTSTLTVSLVTSLEDLQNSSIVLYPNPTSDILQIKLDDAGNYQTAIFGQDGKMLDSQNPETNEGVLNISVKQLPAGIYTLQISRNGETVTKRFVKE